MTVLSGGQIKCENLLAAVQCYLPELVIVQDWRNIFNLWPCAWMVLDFLRKFLDFGC
jgi:hypothetical protein